MTSSDDHRCEWRARAEALEAQLAAQDAEANARFAQLQAQLEKLQRHVFGKRSEKMPAMADELRRSGVKTDPEQAKAKRRANAESKKSLPEEAVKHAVPEERRVCPACSSRDLKPLGAGKITDEIEWVPGHFLRRKHTQEVLACSCGEGIVTADPPPRVFDKAAYGPAFLAHLCVSKCADSIPFYRLAKQFHREGVPISRSTMIDLFHRSASLLEPLYRRVLELIGREEIVRADETVIRVQQLEKTRRAWIWTFVGEKLVGYKYSASRSGETPSQVLGSTRGSLVVDGYSGYNQVTTPERRERVGCWAHARRHFFDGQAHDPAVADKMLRMIRLLYRVEHRAMRQQILGTEEHLQLRARWSAAITRWIRAFLDEQRGVQLPKGGLGEALGYLHNNWTELTRFLEDARLPLDNNVSERALRVVALGRKNFLFVGHDQGGENLAGIYSLVASCELNDVNPLAYLADVLMRIQHHPAAALDDLLPHRWKPPAPAAPSG